MEIENLTFVPVSQSFQNKFLRDIILIFVYSLKFLRDIILIFVYSLKFL